VHRIAARVHPRAIELAGRQHPDSAIAGRYSLQHAAALALSRRAAGLATFDRADVNDPELVALRSRMVVESDAALRPAQARVTLELTDGRRHEHAVDHPSGSPERPLSDAQLRDKFMELAQRAIDGGAAQQLYALCLDVQRVADVTALRQHWAAGKA
ncbi:MAG TPA: hypothetical protein VGP15_17910, partial [Burkholderiales bacterium]|nr:hypothetical protein [Burkholderiales bacterium]